MKPKTIYVLLLGLISAHTKAQTDSIQIKSYVNQIMIRVNVDTNLESFTYSETNGEDVVNELIFSINNKTKASLSVDYRSISATLSFAPRFFPGNNDNNLKGNSSYTDFRFRFFPKRFIQTVYYKNVKGFYIENMGHYSRVAGRTGRIFTISGFEGADFRRFYFLCFEERFFVKKHLYTRGMAKAQ